MNTSTHTYSRGGSASNFFSFSSKGKREETSAPQFYYEKDNHLGSVLTTVSDRKLPHSTNGTTVDYYLADVQSATDMYCGGFAMPGRSFNPTAYRYGFGNHEKDDEISGSGNAYDFEGYGYDPRLMRRKSLDKLSGKYPYESNYSYVSNNPIIYVDRDGKDRTIYLNVILKDGTTLAVATYRQINNETRFHVSTSTGSDGLGGGIGFYSTDVKQTVTYDSRTGAYSVSDVESDYSDIKSGLYHFEKSAIADAINYEPKGTGEQPGGFRLTNEFSEALGAKTNATDEDAQTLDITALDATLTALKGVGQLPKLKEGLGAAEFINTVKEISAGANEAQNKVQSAIDAMQNTGNDTQPKQASSAAPRDKTSATTKPVSKFCFCGGPVHDTPDKVK